QPASIVESRSRRIVRLRCVQRRRLLPRRRSKGGVGNDFHGALSERRAGGREETAAGTAAFLCLVLIAGHDPAPPDASTVAGGFRRPLGDPVERYASLHRRSPADAAAG